MTAPQISFECSSARGIRRIVTGIDGVVWLGRDPASAVQLTAPNISRRHASVELLPAGLRITDASSNGTLVDGEMLKRTARVVSSPTVTLRIGPFTIKVTTGGTPPNGEHLAAATAFPSSATDEPTDPATRVQPPNDVCEAPVHQPLPAASAELRRKIHRALLDNLELPSLDRAPLDAGIMRPKVVAALRRIVTETLSDAKHEAQERLVQELTDEALGLGPLEALLADLDVNEIMVVDPKTIFAERRGKMELTGLEFTDDDSVRAAIERIVTPLGRRIDESTPLVDARLKDGSRVNAVIPPLALRGPCITIRKFPKKPLRMADLQKFGSVTAEMARFLENAVLVRKNIVISGGTGSGKTTLLNVLSGAIPSSERVVTVEDAAELQLAQPHVVSLEARPPNLEGKGEYSIRDLVKNALRMRPDRIVVGECRGGEALDMLQAMNTGHEGSLTTTHANSPREAVQRIETLCLMAGLDLPIRAIRQQIASSVHLIVQQSRFSDGSRRVTSIAEVIGLNDDGDVELREIFGFRLNKASGARNVEGEFLATGYLPSFLSDFLKHGLLEDGAFL
jgi:pilus assembly protein CpaF